MAVTTSSKFWKVCSTLEQMQRRYLKMGVRVVFHHRVLCVSHVLIVSSVIFLLSLFFPRIYFVLQEKQWKALLRLFPPRRALVNISRITC